MSVDNNDSFAEQYMTINTKLKKRFMKKPNISEATNEFLALAIQCEHSEQPAFAGQAYIGAAKCEASAGNFLGEAEHYLSAARQYIKAEMKLSSLKLCSPARENLEAGIGCYLQSLHKYPENSPLRTSILMELANNLVILKHRLEAISYYELVLQDVEEMSLVRLTCLSHLLDLNIECGRFEFALETANNICDSKISIPENTLSEIQITRILLTLLVEPSEDKKTDSLEQLFTHLLNDDDLPIFNTELKLKLQSIIICCTAKDLEALVEISADTTQCFTIKQQELLIKLIRNLEQSV